MQDRYYFKNHDLVLKVHSYYDPEKLKLGAWSEFIDRLCGDRVFQKEAINSAITFLASGRYGSINDLVEENYKSNNSLQDKFPTIDNYLSNLQLPDKLFANIDLATGTGKSYVIYGISQIMLGLGLIDRVLVLCPSLTIEAGLLEKFLSLSGDPRLREVIPEDAFFKSPGVITANDTIQNGDICVENIHAVYERTGSSIQDSLKGLGKRTLVLNDESHHIFNSSKDSSIKKWKNFLLSPDYNFKYILGFTGTAYIKDDYFNDVVYRYSLRQAVDAGIIKNISYVQKDDSINNYEKFQKIFQNHKSNISRYPLIKPLTILITKDISFAASLREDLVDFLIKEEGIEKDVAEKKVLIVTSHKDHKHNIPLLKSVDDKENPCEWIVSVSMLTEGWDVKNVFQIVPWEDRAFNSKLLIAQVLGRGLRLPAEYVSPQPNVIVFNHDAWSRNIAELVKEILELEIRIYSNTLLDGYRAALNFNVYNLDYDRIEEEVDNNRDESVMDFSKMEKNGIRLVSQVLVSGDKETSFVSISDSHTQTKKYKIVAESCSVDEVVDHILIEFKNRDWEGKVLKLGEDQYTQNNLPPYDRIKQIILNSMRSVSIVEDRLSNDNKTKVLQAFGTLLRRKTKTVVPRLKTLEPFVLSTSSMHKESLGVGNLRKDHSVFYSSDYKTVLDEEQLRVISDVISDETLPKSSSCPINEFLFKTPLDIILTASEPERSFVRKLCDNSVVPLIESWVKSRDRGFYSLAYTWRKNNHQLKNQSFNPDFFIKVVRDNFTYFLVVEIKCDGDDSDENKAKYKYGVMHFNKLNEELLSRGIAERYLFHFLSPSSYSEFFSYLKNGSLLQGQGFFRCELELALEKSD
ncbi:MAG TPA: DEAD/DEAH box helicase family protein [bacterium]|nr:DEAD/DEAH box helicase family protein [bacterium]